MDIRPPKLIKQRTTTTCDQCVIAMVLGVTRMDAIKKVGHAGITTDEELRSVTKYFEV